MAQKRGNNSRNEEKGNNKKPSASSGSNNRRRNSASSGEGLDDLTYNVITVLHEKSKGLEAYEQYIEDASDNDEVREIFEELRDQDQETVTRLEECLRTLVGGESAEYEEEEEGEEGVA